MAAVTVTIPHMLASLIEGRRVHTVEAGTVWGALHALFDQHPELAVHVFDEAGEIRPHVSCFHAGSVATIDAPVSDGDEIVVLQAVSGG